MKNLFLVANWKATMTIKDSVSWVKEAKPSLEEVENATIIVCPPFTTVPFITSMFQKTNLKTGAQDVSKFTKGAYTGEVTVEMLDGLIEYCIIGHSERRRYFSETNQDIFTKLQLLLKSGITPVLCISDLEQMDSYLKLGEEIKESRDKIIFVYEPPGAISGGKDYHPEDPEVANNQAGKISEKIGKKVTTLYGGSVNPENISSFCSLEHIDGALVGQASTDPGTFLALISSLRLNTVVD